MIAEARKRAHDRGLKIRFEVGDARARSEKDGGFFVNFTSFVVTGVKA